MLLASPLSASNAPIDPVKAYGGEIRFDVLRNGTQAGRHIIRFEEDEEVIEVDSQFELSIRLLFFTAYSYRYESRSVWRNGRLHHLDATINDDGETSGVTVISFGDRMSVTGPNGELSIDQPIFPTNHWNADVLRQSRVLNTITGLVNAVVIEPVRSETVETERGPITATRYAYSGELETEVLYDDVGRWVGMAFEGRDGSSIEYICRQCQGGKSLSGAP